MPDTCRECDGTGEVFSKAEKTWVICSGCFGEGVED